MPGVAYTTSGGYPTRKEIHFSLDYIKSVSPSLAVNEIRGVLAHEVVHCYQYDAKGTCPGGLIEGVADFVRLKEQLAPPHWKNSFPPRVVRRTPKPPLRVQGGEAPKPSAVPGPPSEEEEEAEASKKPTKSKKGDRWDSGYQVTGFFLNWLENRYGHGTIRDLNAHFEGKPYDKRVWKDVTGRKVSKLWRLYCDDVGAIEVDDDELGEDDGHAESEKEVIFEIDEDDEDEAEYTKAGMCVKDSHTVSTLQDVVNSNDEDAVLIDKEDL
jgi:hypothetical protein